jgi:hypothetical protein
MTAVISYFWGHFENPVCFTPSNSISIFKNCNVESRKRAREEEELFGLL